MYIVVIGLGEVGRHLLTVLQREGHDVVAVDRDPSAVRYAEEHFDVATLIGYGASQDVLISAGVANADLVVAVSDHDEVNLIAALAAKQLGARHVVARAQGNEWSTWTAGIRHGLLGVDVVINPRVLVGQELARIARSHGASDVINLAQGRVELVEIEMGSRMANKPISSLSLPNDVLVAARVRDEELVIPSGDDVLLPGDRVYLIGLTKAITQAEDMFSKKREANRVCIIGGGVVGQSLARELLAHNTDVAIVESDEAVAEKLAADLDGVTIIHGDGTDKALLEEAEIDTYDLCCAVTAQDEINLMASLIASRAGVPRVAAIVQRADYITIYRQLGLDIVLSPRTVASDHILRFARRGGLHSLHGIEDGAAEVVELTAQGDCRAVGVPLRRMHLPRGALVAALVRRGSVRIPRGDDEVEPGDRVILMVSKHARAGIERLFRSRQS